MINKAWGSGVLSAWKPKATLSGFDKPRKTQEYSDHCHISIRGSRLLNPGSNYIPPTLPYEGCGADLGWEGGVYGGGKDQANS